MRRVQSKWVKAVLSFQHWAGFLALWREIKRIMRSCSRRFLSLMRIIANNCYCRSLLKRVFRIIAKILLLREGWRRKFLYWRLFILKDFFRIAKCIWMQEIGGKYWSRVWFWLRRYGMMSLLKMIISLRHFLNIRLVSWMKWKGFFLIFLGIICMLEEGIMLSIILYFEHLQNKIKSHFLWNLWIFKPYWVYKIIPIKQWLDWKSSILNLWKEACEIIIFMLI